MIGTVPISCIGLVVAVGLGSLVGGLQASPLTPFLEKHCVACHGADKQKGDRRFDTLAFPIADGNTLADYQDILDLLNLGEMPPEDEPQPTSEERAEAIGWLTGAVAEAHAAVASTGGETVLRRLTAREYRHTIGDLLAIDVVGFDPTTSFPSEREAEHLDNVGDTLVTSGFLLANYLDAAVDSVGKALPAGRPEKRKWVFEDGFTQQPEFDYRVRKFHPKYPFLRVTETLSTTRHFGSHAPLLKFKEGVPHDGHYRIRLEVEPKWRQPRPEYGKKNLANLDLGENAILGIIPGDIRYGDLHMPQPLEPLLAALELEEKAEPYPVEVTVFLHAGTSPRFTYLNGPSDMRPVNIKAAEYEAKIRKKKGAGEFSGNDLFGWSFGVAKTPQIHIHRVEIEGPLYPDGWPTPGMKSVLPETDGWFKEEEMRKNLTAFLRRAYRRPVGEGEVEPFMELIGTQINVGGRSARLAYRDALAAILCSPSFLFLDEPAGDPSAGAPAATLSSHALATRLSYFLTSGPPDAELSAVADAGELDAELAGHVDRLLASEGADRFIAGFLDAWITLRYLGDTPPDPNADRVYYRDQLEEAMRQETRLFARRLLDNDRPIDLFLDADFTFLNRPLARHYGLPHEDLHRLEFQRVALPEKSPRGGLLGHGSVLAVTANGVETSPVTRGVWILENILGTPTAPPPPDVEALVPDTRGATTVRELLAAHRADPSCAECHRKIDPLGFALEVFDPIGRHREKYEIGKKKLPIDATGTLPGGQEFSNLREFKEGLSAHRDQFARALAEKLLAYGLGRRLEITDRPAIDKILEDLDASDTGRGFRTLVRLVALSEPMRRP